MSEINYLKNLNQIDLNSSIYIYGSGTFGRSFYFSIKAFRPDINILGFLDSKRNGELFELSVIKVNDFANSKKNYHNIIICADSIHWITIVNILNEIGIKSYLVNLYWDFDVYGKKDISKYNRYKHLIKKVRNIFINQEDKMVWDTITFSMSNNNIERSFEYWDEHKDKTDYYKSMEFNNGDVVINGGAAFGNDTQYFDDQVGDNGIVYAFDPNMSENNNVKSQSIKIIPKVLWNKTTQVSFIMDGTRSRIINDKNKTHAILPAITIDDFVNNQQLDRLDFIKLDVEGVEMNVLNGGIVSIKKFRPALAISIYHKLEDFFDIPIFLNELLADYVFHIKYFNPYCIDTIIFAVPIERQ